MTNSEIIHRLIISDPGLTDRQILERTGIRPHQQVNQICRRLAKGRMIRRERGPDGRIRNFPVGRHRPSDDKLEAVTGPTQSPYEEPMGTTGPGSFELPALDPERTLIIIQCSGKKDPGGAAPRSVRMCDVLPAELAEELRTARNARAPHIALDESALLPAWRRYTGRLYESASSTIGSILSQGGHVLILSGGYGVLQAQEPIGWYKGRLRRSDWPHDLLSRCIGAYAEHYRFSSAVGLLSASTDYAEVMRRVAWRAVGVSETYLACPLAGGGEGAQLTVPRAQGEALSAYIKGELTSSWQSSDGLPIPTVRLV